MKRLIIGITLSIAIALAMTGAAAASDGHTGARSAFLKAAATELSPKACGGGTLVVNVEQKVLNDADSGVAGNVWAFDRYERHIKVWQTAPGEFCAVVRYEGKFTTVAGTSPGGSDSVGDGIEGEMKGGYRATFSGTFAPSAPTHGDLGSYDYACDTSYHCPGYVDWTTLYFSSTSGFDMPWWGWVYHADGNGTWINAFSGNSGDITGVARHDD